MTRNRVPNPGNSHAVMVLSVSICVHPWPKPILDLFNDLASRDTWEKCRHEPVPHRSGFRKPCVRQISTPGTAKRQNHAPQPEAGTRRLWRRPPRKRRSADAAAPDHALSDAEWSADPTAYKEDRQAATEQERHSGFGYRSGRHCVDHDVSVGGRDFHGVQLV